MMPVLSPQCRDQWIANITKSCSNTSMAGDKTPSTFVCALHFRAKDFVPASSTGLGQWRRISKEAVPTVFPRSADWEANSGEILAIKTRPLKSPLAHFRETQLNADPNEAFPEGEATQIGNVESLGLYEPSSEETCDPTSCLSLSDESSPSECDSPIRRPKSAKRHRLSSDDEVQPSSYSCSVERCLFTAKNETDFEKHLSYHVTRDVRQCPVCNFNCGKSAKDKVIFEKHIEKDHPFYERKPKPAEKPVANTKKISRTGKKSTIKQNTDRRRRKNGRTVAPSSKNKEQPHGRSDVGGHTPTDFSKVLADAHNSGNDSDDSNRTVKLMTPESVNTELPPRSPIFIDLGGFDPIDPEDAANLPGCSKAADTSSVEEKPFDVRDQLNRFIESLVAITSHEKELLEEEKDCVLKLSEIKASLEQDILKESLVQASRKEVFRTRAIDEKKKELELYELEDRKDGEETVQLLVQESRLRSRLNELEAVRISADLAVLTAHNERKAAQATGRLKVNRAGGDAASRTEESLACTKLDERIARLKTIVKEITFLRESLHEISEKREAIQVSQKSRAQLRDITLKELSALESAQPSDRVRQHVNRIRPKFPSYFRLRRRWIAIQCAKHFVELGKREQEWSLVIGRISDSTD